MCAVRSDGESNASPQSEDKRPIKLSQPVEFESIEHLRTVLNDSLSKADDFVTIPQPRSECQILTFPKGSRNNQYLNCLEQDCGNLVYFFDQSKSMIEILELHETEEWQTRVQQFHEWHDETYNKKDKWTWESKDDRKSWNKGSSKRSQSLPASAEGRTDPSL